MHTLQQKHILILGLGSSGLAMARWCVRNGARVTVADTRTAPAQLAILQHEIASAYFVGGPFSETLLDNDVDAVFVSPGLKPSDTYCVLEAARKHDLWTGGELDLFVHALQRLRQELDYAPYILAITGTNGKTTVTSLTGQLLLRAGQTVAVAGNIGPTLLDTLSARLDADDLPQSWVLELSSFQLNTCTVFEPTAATILNITQDHLDWHESMDDYARAKTNIFGRHGVAILNRDDSVVMSLGSQLAFESIESKYTNTKKSASTAATRARRQVSFGSNVPQYPGDFGLEMTDNMLWLVRAIDDDTLAARSRQTRKTAAAAAPVQLQRLMPADALRIRGRHNACNALAALALASETGAALAPMLYGLREYRGEAHRVEPIAIINEVEYFDDSKGTNVGATLAALQGLGFERKLVVILGGEGKGQNFTPLALAVQNYCRSVILIGRDAALIEAALTTCDVPLIHADSLPNAVALAKDQALPGDAVLLSPACASFDMFRDYAHRAEVFRAVVLEQIDQHSALQEGNA